MRKQGNLGSLPPFAAFAQQKKRADALSVRFLRAALSISHLQRMSAIRGGLNWSTQHFNL
jgi:hypothetical protein